MIMQALIGLLLLLRSLKNGLNRLAQFIHI